MTSTPGRVQRLPRAQRRVQLLAAAQRVFVEKGYHAAAMEDIADEAGISKPVLYQHFPGKLDLYLALIDEACDRIQGLVLEALNSSDDPKDRVYATIAVFFQFVGEADGGYRLIFESDLGNEERVRERLERAETAVCEAIADRITRDTELPRDYAMFLGLTLAGMAQISARAWLDHGTGIPQADAARAAGHLAWRGIGTYPSRATVKDRQS